LWFPTKSKIVIRTFWDEKYQMPIMQLKVHPDYPNRWREEPYYSSIKRMAVIGLLQPEIILVQVSCNDDLFVIYPTRDIHHKLTINEEEKALLLAETELAIEEWEAIKGNAMAAYG
jgi:hypothetical protein